MEKLVFFGKGGIGKSTTSSCISATLAATGQRVLQVGCDPKHDSTVLLLRGQMIDPVVDRKLDLSSVKPEDIVARSHLGIDCVEAGGPEAGVGCGGRGVSRMIEIFNAAKLLSPERYDTTIFDVLGDVVCGGFAAPLKKGVGEKIIIVASEEVMALYAANNIAKAVVNYAANGVKLAGIVVNLRDNNEDRAPVERFARLINTRVLGYIPRDPLIREAEYRRQTVVEMAPASPIAKVYRELAKTILAIEASQLPLPTPLSEQRFYALTPYRFEEPPGGIAPAGQNTAAAMTPGAELPGGATAVGLRLASRAAPSATPQKTDFDLELRSGRRAVRAGRVSAVEAVNRLKAHFGEQAASLRIEDLTTIEERVA